ncbi:HD domain-containing phosphohydrolase [Nitrospinota bacterium]
MKRAQKLLIVDDEIEQAEFLEKYFKSENYEVEIARDGFEALAKIKLDIDLVLLDIRMPGMDGYEVARRIRDDPSCLDVPIVMVTVLGSRQDRLRAVEAGANDFISKPIDMTEMKVRTTSLLKMKEASDALKNHQKMLEDHIKERTAALRQTLQEVAESQRLNFEAHLDTIRRLAVVAEYKDKDTAAHIQRVKEYSVLLAQGLDLPPGEVELIHHASPMHDVGKIIVPEKVLLKPAQLTEDEWVIMRRHTTVGGDILGGSSSNLLQTGEAIALSHHEKWDGSGYPNGLTEEHIPVAGRITAVVDVFDALSSERPYKKAFSLEDTLEILSEGKGKHFDPRVVDVFFQRRSAIVETQKKYQGETEGEVSKACSETGN